MSETNVEYEFPQPALYKVEWPEIPAVYDHKKRKKKAPRVRGGIGRTSCADIANKCIVFKWDVLAELERETEAERAEALKDAIARDGNTLGGWDGDCTKFLAVRIKIQDLINANDVAWHDLVKDIGDMAG